MKKILIAAFTYFFVSTCFAQSKNYESLLQLTKDLRQTERTTLPNGVPDYSNRTIVKIQQLLLPYKVRHAKIDTTGWSTEQRVDYVLLLAEMNALDYNCRILQPWVRDPAFYAIVWNEQSDTPDHEGPTSFAAIELWKYPFPLSEADAAKLTAQLKIIPSLYEQAKVNLTGNAKDLWSAGIGNIKDQVTMLDELANKTTNSSNELKKAIADAKNASLQLAIWLQKQLPAKNGPSGIGKENYNWHLKNVLLVPLTWEDEVILLKRELTRAYASLQLERERNKQLPELTPIANAEQYTTKTDAAVTNMMRFLKEKKILPIKDYMEPEIRKHLGEFVPEQNRNFFTNISHRATAVLYSHLTHWFEVAGLTQDPHASLLRKEALPFNMWMMRNEGLATGMEEILMHAGMWDENPRARELVWIMLAQRCARGLASLYAQANLIDYEEARKFQVEWTPKGWTGDESLVGFEQHLYLRQPAYGTSYVTGKYLIEKLMMDRGRLQQNNFTLYDFFEKFYAAGIIPVSLVGWQMTGSDEEIKRILRK
jgi:Bacterial protein of unknown function (DUF885)